MSEGQHYGAVTVFILQRKKLEHREAIAIMFKNMRKAKFYKMRMIKICFGFKNNKYRCSSISKDPPGDELEL